MTTMRCWTTLLTALLIGAAPAVAAEEPEYVPDPGKTEQGVHTFNGAEYPYILYTPTTVKPGEARPLVIVVHGCQTTAEQEVKITGYNKLAERERVYVLYPEADAQGRNQPGPLRDCWKFVDPQAYFRGSGDTAALAGMTRQVLDAVTVDEERVYLVGVSAGGLMSSVLASAYSELYTAVALMASAGFLDGPCFTTGVGQPVETSATLAFEQMRGRERVVPIMTVVGDQDLAFPPLCSAKAVQQGLRVSNLAISGSQQGPISLVPALIREGQKPGGMAFTVAEFRDPDGCLIAERWVVHGMGHAWPGDSGMAGYSEDKAPDGAEATWAFLSRYRKSETSLPCAESPAPPVAERACPPGWLTVAVPRGARRVRATVAGRRVKVLVKRGKARVRLPAGRQPAAKVVVRGRTADGERFVRRRTDRRCG